MPESLDGCVTSLNTSVSFLGASLNSLDTITDDFSRLQDILAQTRIFTLIPEYDLNNAKKSVVDEVEPKIFKLIEQIKIKLSKLERRHASLTSKVKLNSVRLNTFRTDQSKSDQDLEVNGTADELEKLRQLRLKKDRLRYKLSSINLQNRKTRLSMVNK